MRALLATSFLVIGALGCSEVLAPRPCVSDAECGEGSICFAEGCGDPGTGIVVEVEGPASSAYRARDFRLPDGSLGAVQDFSMGEPLTLTGQLQRKVAGDTDDRVPYTDGVVVRASGTSTLIPGITRIFETRFERPEFGVFTMNVGEGSYSMMATPTDTSVPPVAAERTTVISAEASASVNFTFPAVDGAPALSGRLVRKFDERDEPVLVSAPYTLAMEPVPQVDLQLFDASNLQPLSQRFPIGQTTGEFAVNVSPDARTRARLVLVATPREPGVAIPTKRFELTTPLPPAVSLAFGDYGNPATVRGKIVDSQGTPVAGAHVVLEGTVVGDGTFRSKVVVTDENGQFSVISLPSRGEGTFKLSVVPPQSSRAAYTQRSVTVISNGTTMKLEPADITLQDRFIVRGSVLLPNGKPAPKVAVRATYQANKPDALEVRSLPLEPAEVATNDEGRFELRLDPGQWRFEYQPVSTAVESLPMASRLVIVEPTIDDKGEASESLELPAVQLSFGRAVTGTVRGMRSGDSVKLPFAQLRFFRVTTIGGKPVSILLSSTIADEDGKYNAVLPSVMSTLRRSNATP